MNNQGSGGIYSKFQERLRRIRLARSERKQKNDEFVQEKVKEIREVIREDIKDKTFIQHKKVIVEKEPNKYFDSPKIKVVSVKQVEDKKVTVISKGVDDVKKVSVPKKRNYGYVGTKKIREKKNRAIGIDDKKELLRDLGAEIIDKIKGSFEDKLDELEVLESELYILRQKQDNELELKKVKEIKDRINELIERINEIIDQYNLYKKNYYIDNVIDIDDNIIVDDIINYRELLDSLDGEKEFVKEYKALEEFKSLYNSLKEVRDDTERLQYDNEEKIVKYEIRDKKYDNIKLGMVNIDDIDKKCSLEIERQNKYFNNLMGKIDVIDREEYVTMHMRGIGELVNQSLRYMGLVMLSPLIGLIPGIATQTLATRRMIRNIRQNLHVEEIRHVHYEAVNYDSELNHHLSDIGYTEGLIDDTLRDVERLKEDFMIIYNSKIPGYDETLKKIEKIENKLIRNQNKVAIVKRNLKKSKKLNEDKLKRVRKLNEQENRAA